MTTPFRAVSDLAQTFLNHEGFEPDPFQFDAFAAIDAQHNVLVSAPTGSGKTLIGEYAAYRALKQGQRCFYTTPIKALSNQKFKQFQNRFGIDNVGLLTGDHSINREARVVVMTTEVLRNMIYSDAATLNDLECVVMDEIHYLGDRTRGVVWEEIILSLNTHVRIIGLSATVSNADELGEWLTSVRGSTATILSEKRPVPLAHLLLMHGDFVPIRSAAKSRRQARTSEERQRQPRALWARRRNVIDTLAKENLLPAIYFIFSRAGCDGAVAQMQRARVRLTTGEESSKIAAYIDNACREVSRHDLDALDFGGFRAALIEGIAAHHAGMLPLFRVIVEHLFAEGLVKVVFATETLALGIHMPARAVVLEKIVKYDGDGHVLLSAADYSQITGRAGRRGIDTQGTAIVLDQPDIELDALSALVSSPRFPLYSAFTPDYSMAVNLVQRLGLDEATSLVERSFAQFQTNQTLVARASDLDSQQVQRDRLRTALDKASHGENLTEYMSYRTELSRLERQAERADHKERGEAITKAMLRQQRGAIITVGWTRFGLVATVLQVRDDNPDDPALLCISDTGWTGWLRRPNFSQPPIHLGEARLPKGTGRPDSASRKFLIKRMEDLRGRAKGRLKTAKKPPVRKDPRIAEVRRKLRENPLHGTPDIEKLVRLYERWAKADSVVNRLRQEIDSDADSLARRFRRIVDLLLAAGYLERRGPHGIQANAAGILLAGLHSEQDLLIAHCLRNSIWTDLDSAGLAAVVTAIVAHPRGDTRMREPSDVALRDALRSTLQVAQDVTALEREHRVPVTPNLDWGLAPAVHHWVSGGSLSSVLAASWQEGVELTAGDFVRAARLVADMLVQIGQIADAEVARVARSAAGSLRRGLVADQVG